MTAGRDRDGRAVLAYRLVALALAALALAVGSGCGADDVDPVPAAEAAERTRAAETAQAEVRMTLSGMGLEEPLVLTGSGVVATAAPRMDVTFDLRPLLDLVGIAGDGATRLLVDGADVYVDPPPIEGLEVPDGATWVTIDLGRVVRSFGIDARGLADLMRLTPEQQLDALAASGSMETVGQAEIDGVNTSHQRGSLRLSDFVAALPADRRARARRAIRQLDRLPGGDAESFDAPTPTEMWVDEDKLLRRMTQSAPIPAEAGMPAGRFEVQIDLSNFGAELDIPQPEGGDVYDATRPVARELRSSGTLSP